MARFIFLGEAFDGRTYEITKEQTRVGRAAHNDLSISHQSLSREHCEIFLNGSELIIRDLGARNGVLIDGRPLNGGQAQVRHGQTISLGGVQIRLELDYIDDPPDEITAHHQFLKYRASRREPERGGGRMLKTSSSDHEPDLIDETLSLSVSVNAPATVATSVERFHPFRLAWILVSLLVGLGLIGCLVRQSAGS